MTWEPTSDEVAAYEQAARMRASKAEPYSADVLVTAGLRAAYAKLEERLAAGDLLPPVAGEFVELRPPLMQYEEASNLDDVDELAAAGWRLHTVQFVDAGDGDRGWSYVLERERPDPPQPAP